MKLEGRDVRPRRETDGAAGVNGWMLRKRLPFVAAAVCACALLVVVQASSDYYQCYQAGTCTGRALSNATDCVEGADYDVTVSNTGSSVTVLSFHGGRIELNTSGISAALANLYGWNRYDFNADGSPQCLNGISNFDRLHITSTNFNDPRAVSLVSAHPKAVAIHGHGKSYPKGAICVGGLDATARSAFISYVNANASSWQMYLLNPIDATTASSGSTCGDDGLRGIAPGNLVNRTQAGGGGLQLELHKDFRADLVNTSTSYDGLRAIVYEAIRRAMSGPSDCYTATAGGGWVNNSFTSQADTFTAEWDATPSAKPIDAVMALSDGAQTAFSGFACLTRFNSSGTIDARDGGTYRAASSISYEPNKLYHFRLVVNIPAHTYSVYVTPAGGSEQVVGLNYAFRTEQSTVGSLNNYGLRVDSAAGSVRLCDFRIGTDRFGITMLNPTVPGGREWFSKWDNGHSRTITFGQDPDDAEFHGRGQASYSIDGQGVLTASGAYVRMYVYDPAFQDTSVYNPSQFTTWNNVEVTVYFMRVSDANVAYGGIVAGAKIRHIPDSDLCGTRGYYGRVRNDGGIDVEKEIRHPNSVPIASPTSPWSALPHNVWIGYKYIVRDVDAGTHVKMELWRDMTGGANGGAWERLYEYTDAGGWGAGQTPCATGVDPAQILPGRNLSVFLRNDSVSDVRYKKWSIREIAAQ